MNLLCAFAAAGQSKTGNIQGNVKGIDGQPVALASVYLLKAADSIVIKLTITDQNGVFRFNDVQHNKYIIRTTCTGYSAKLAEINFTGAETDLDAGIIQINKNSTSLREVTIVPIRNFMDVKPGKTILNIQNSVLSAGNTALGILKMAPGVQLDNNDNILLNGKPDVLVLIDNKPTYLSNSALTDLLRGTQSSMIDKIEIITNPNATYDAGGTGGVINIKMVRNKNVGFNMQVNTGQGITLPTNAQYDVASRTSVGLNVNYRTKTINVFGSYTYTSVPNFRSSATERINNYNGVIDVIKDNWFIDQRRANHNFRLGADYNLNAKHTIGFLVSGLFLKLSGPKNTVSNISRFNNVDSTILTSSALTRNQGNLAYNFNYKGSLGSNGNLIIDGDYINFDRHYNEQIVSNYFYNSNITTPFRSISLLNSTPSSFDVFVFNANYNLTINTNSNFSAGFKDTYAKTNNTSDFGTIVNGVYTSLPAFTGRFKYTEKLQAAYVTYSRTLNKKSNLELGLRAEQIISDAFTPDTFGNIHNNYINFFPNVQYSYLPNADNQLKFTYRRSISPPKYEELNPFTVYSDQYTYQQGNPYLKPFYSNALELNHIYKSNFSTSVGFSVINGFTQIVYMQDDKNKVTTLKKINLGNRYNYDIHFLSPVTFTKAYGVDFDFDFKYQQFTSTDNPGDLNSGSPDITLKATQHFKLPLGLRADLISVYETPTTFGILRYKSDFFAYASINKSLFNKQGNITLLIDNIFQSDKNVYTSHYQNLNISGTQINIFRSFILNFSYAFGSKTIKAARRSTAADDEQGRLGN